MLMPLKTGNIDKDLEKCKTLRQVVHVMDQYYNIDKELGPMSKPIVLDGIKTLVQVTGLKKR